MQVKLPEKKKRPTRSLVNRKENLVQCEKREMDEQCLECSDHAPWHTHAGFTSHTRRCHSPTRWRAFGDKWWAGISWLPKSSGASLWHIRVGLLQPPPLAWFAVIVVVANRENAPIVF
jgi:hypothetical protein